MTISAQSKEVTRKKNTHIESCCRIKVRVEIKVTPPRVTIPAPRIIVPTPPVVKEVVKETGKVLSNSAKIIGDGAKDIRNSIASMQGVNVEIFNWSVPAEVEFIKKSNLFQDGRIPYEEVKKTLAYVENKQWAEDLLKKGYTIFDIGDPKLANYTQGLSAFYDLELELIFGAIK